VFVREASLRAMPTPSAPGQHPPQRPRPTTGQHKHKHARTHARSRVRTCALTFTWGLKDRAAKKAGEVSSGSTTSAKPYKLQSAPLCPRPRRARSACPAVAIGAANTQSATMSQAGGGGALAQMDAALAWRQLLRPVVWGWVLAAALSWCPPTLAPPAVTALGDGQSGVLMMHTAQRRFPPWRVRPIVPCSECRGGYHELKTKGGLCSAMDAVSVPPKMAGRGGVVGLGRWLWKGPPAPFGC
jgi:hypothetical protein